jgi:hypothetical protein
MSTRAPPPDRCAGRIAPAQRRVLHAAFAVDPGLQGEVLTILDGLCVEAWPRIVDLLVDELRLAADDRPAAALYPWLARLLADRPPEPSSS